MKLRRPNTTAALPRICSWRERQGNVAVEFAVILPVLLLMVLGIIEFGRLLWTQSSVQHAVEAGARYAAIYNPKCTNGSLTPDTPSYAAAQVFGQSLPASDFKLTCITSCGVLVQATVPFSFVVPKLFPYSITLKAQSCYPT